MTAVIKFQNLTLGYDRLPAVQELDAEVQEGSLTAVVGPNGAGKSTLLKGVTGALSPLDGGILIDGFRRDEIAYLPQQSQIDGSFPISVIDLVAMGLWHEIGAFGRLSRKFCARARGCRYRSSGFDGIGKTDHWIVIGWANAAGIVCKTAFARCASCLVG